MNITLREKILSIIIVVTLLSHLTFLHNVLENYVVCIGTDGHIAVENVSECDECIETEFLASNDVANIEVSKTDCEDISLDQNCFEINQFVTKNKIDISENVFELTAVLSESRTEIKYYYSINNNKDKNPILKNYTTVSLLI